MFMMNPMLWFPIACCSSLPFLGNSSSPLFISGSYLETRLSRSKLPLLNASGFSQCPRNSFAQKGKRIYYHHDVLFMSFNEGCVAGIAVQRVNDISPSWLVTLYTVKPSIFPICMHAAWALLASCLLQHSGKCFQSLTHHINQSVLRCFREITKKGYLLRISFSGILSTTCQKTLIHPWQL